MFIPNEFLESEVRDGFYISAIMKRALAATLEVLNEITIICNKHNIPYFVDFGTLLGTVRHEGFIPWDDDFDICMKREDYMRFLDIIDSELPERYRVLNFYKEHEYDTFLTRIVNESSISFNHDFLEKYHGFPYIAGIDVFPLDYLSRDKRKQELQKSILLHVQIAANELTADQTEPGDQAEILEEIERLTNRKIVPGQYIKQQLYIIMDDILSMFTSRDSDMIGHLPLWAAKGTRVYPKEYFKYSISMDYEFFKIPVPIGYDAILKDKFSASYLNPVRDWSTHDYPFYHIMEDTVRDVLGEDFYAAYQFDKNDLLHDRTKSSEVKRQRREVVFMPFKAQYWNTMEGYWLKETNNPECDVYVIPIPYFDRKSDRNSGNLYYEGDKFPEYVTVTGFDEYDFASRRPDAIYISNPYDLYDASLVVHPYFFTDKLKAVTDELIYIPYFILDEYKKEDYRAAYSGRFYIRVPGVTRADKVLVQSENMRQRYIEELVRFAGEDTREAFSKRIQVRTEPVSDSTVAGLLEEEVPEDWWQHFLNEDGSGKKIIMYYTSASNLFLGKKKYIEKMRSVFEQFKDNVDTCILWHPHAETEVVLAHENSALSKEYNKLKDEFVKNNIGIYDPSGDSYKALAICDAFYGDRGPEAYKARKLGKPVMIQNIEI